MTLVVCGEFVILSHCSSRFTQLVCIYRYGVK